jgi:hypothetical protein
MIDKHQVRYLKHQNRKKTVLKKIIKNHYSERMFSDNVVDEKTIKTLIDSIQLLPSSCDRHGIYIKPISSRDDKNLLSGLLVGGVGWIHRASHIFLLFANPSTYKEKLLYMPYLDAGVVIMGLYEQVKKLSIRGCYVNPQVRGENQIYFKDRFGYDIFCGAFGVGHEH